MTNHFARLQVAPAPWLDPEVLKEHFLTLSADVHPDKAPGDKEKAEVAFRTLNESYQVLRNSRSRILHLLELQGVTGPAQVQAIPSVALDLFSSIADLTRQSDTLLKEKAAANSPMLKVQFFEKALPCVDSIQAAQSEIRRRVQTMEAQLKRLGADQVQELGEAATALGFLEKWQAQLQERIAMLSF